MNNSINTIWTYSYSLIKEKIEVSLTPLQKKVFIWSIAFFACAFLIYIVSLYSRISKKTLSVQKDKDQNQQIEQKEQKIQPEKQSPVIPKEKMIASPDPKKKQLSVEEKLEKNRNYAFEQQKKQHGWKQRCIDEGSEFIKPFKIVEMPTGLPINIIKTTRSDVQSIDIKIKGKFTNDPPLEVGFNWMDLKINDKWVAISRSIGRRKTWEDYARATEGKFQIKDVSHHFELFGVFDGHGGVKNIPFL